MLAGRVGWGRRAATAAPKPPSTEPTDPSFSTPHNPSLSTLLNLLIHTSSSLLSPPAEIIKYGLIRDAPLFDWLEANMGRLLGRDPEVGGCCAAALLWCGCGLRSRTTAQPRSSTPHPGMRARLACTHAAPPLPLHSSTMPTQAFTYAIERSCINKAEVVAADEREGGVRATLNLGHTFGHAIETCTGAPRPWGGRHAGLGCARSVLLLQRRRSCCAPPATRSAPHPDTHPPLLACLPPAPAGYGAWLHGEAVAAGTMMAADMSQRLGWIEPALVQRIRALNEAAKLPIAPPPVRRGWRVESREHGVSACARGQRSQGRRRRRRRCASRLAPSDLTLVMIPAPPAGRPPEHDCGPVQGHDGGGQEGSGRQAAPHTAQVGSSAAAHALRCSALLCFASCAVLGWAARGERGGGRAARLAAPCCAVGWAGKGQPQV